MMNPNPMNVDIHVNCPCSQACMEHKGEVHVLGNNHVRFVFNNGASTAHIRSRQPSQGTTSDSGSGETHSPASSQSSSSKPPSKKRKALTSQACSSAQDVAVMPSSHTFATSSGSEPSINDYFSKPSSSTRDTSVPPDSMNVFWADMPNLSDDILDPLINDLSSRGSTSTPLNSNYDMVPTSSNDSVEELFNFNQCDMMLDGEPSGGKDLPLRFSHLSTSMPMSGIDQPLQIASDASSSTLDASHSYSETSETVRPVRSGGSAPPPPDAGDDDLMQKRTKRLDRLLHTLTTAPISTVSVHNNAMFKLLELQKKGTWDTSSSPGRRCGGTSEESYECTLVKFIADMLAWEAFRREEAHLVEQQGYTAISASKEVNARMMSTRGRNMKSRDWASDGRKAARMTFGALQEQPPAAQLFMLMLLAAHVSSDHMLKTAHFPTLRQRFEGSLEQIVQQRAGDWSMLAAQGYCIIAPLQLLGASGKGV